MSSNTDEPQLTRRQMRERRGVDTQGVPIVSSDAQAASEPAAAPTPPASRSRRVSTSSAVAGGQIPDVQATERDAAAASTDAERAEAARHTAPLLSAEEVAELEKRANAGIPLTRRQARDLEKAKTASVPVITPEEAAAARAAADGSETVDTDQGGAAQSDAKPDDTVQTDTDRRDSTDAGADVSVDSARTETPGDTATVDSAADAEATAPDGEGTDGEGATGEGAEANDTGTDTDRSASDDAPVAKTSKRSKRAEKKAAQEARRVEEAERVAEAKRADAADAEPAATPAPTVATPLRPAFAARTATDDDEAAAPSAPRRSSFTPPAAAAATVPGVSGVKDARTPDEETASADTAARNEDAARDRSAAPAGDNASEPATSTAARTEEDDSDDADVDAPKLAAGFGEGVLDEATAASSAVPHEQPFDRIIARGVEAAEAQAASGALILPTMPTNDSLTGPISSNGNVIVTGSIDLPASLSSTGQHPNYFDKAELDTMFEADEDTAPATAGTPVSAARAVSTHTQTGDVINPPAPSRDHRLLIILAITAGALLTAVLAVVIVGFVVGAF